MARSNSVSLMTEGNIKRLILQYAGPIFIGQLFQQLYNTADAMIVGNFVGQNALAAVTSVGSLSYLFVGFFTGFATGASVIIAREIGAERYENTQKAIHTTVALGLVLSVLMTIAGVGLARPLLVMMDTPSEVLPLAVTYLKIYFWGSLPLVMYNMLVGIIRAGGDSKHPLYYLILSSMLNVVLDVILIRFFSMGVAGAAIATVFSELVSMVLCTVQLMREEGVLHLSWLDVKFDKANLKEIIEYGFPTGLQGCVIDIANVLIQSYINSFGAAAVAGIGAFSKVDGFVFLPVTAFSMALTTFISQNKGAGKMDRVKEGTRFGLFVAIIIVELTGVFVYAFAPQLIRLFNTDITVVSYGVAKARVSSLFYFLLGFSHIVSAILRGIGKPVMPVVVMLICWCAVRVVTLMTLGQVVHDIRITYWLYPLTWFLSSVIYLYWLKKEKLI
jgi:putative MATE family efflux protein